MEDNGAGHNGLFSQGIRQTAASRQFGENGSPVK